MFLLIVDKTMELEIMFWAGWVVAMLGDNWFARFCGFVVMASSLWIKYK